MSNRTPLEINFVTSESAIKIRMMDTMTDTVASAARDLGAKYVVAAFDWDMAAHAPVWSVYEVAKMAPSGGPRGQPSLPLPIKTFTSESSDAAVMYALALQGG